MTHFIRVVVAFSQ